jgi:hypothetical protein
MVQHVHQERADLNRHRLRVPRIPGKAPAEVFHNKSVRFPEQIVAREELIENYLKNLKIIISENREMPRDAVNS